MIKKGRAIRFVVAAEKNSPPAPTRFEPSYYNKWNESSQNIIFFSVAMDPIARMLYQSPDKLIRVSVVYHSGTLWLSVAQMALLFQVSETELNDFVSEDSAFTSPGIADLNQREFSVESKTPGSMDGKQETHYRYEWVILVGHAFNAPHLSHYLEWAGQQIELGLAMDKACAKFPLQPTKFGTLTDESENWLENWRKAAKENLLESSDPRVWKVLKAHWLRQPLRFTYSGGSSPGEIREMIPREVFRADGYRSIWFRGHCPLRGEERTFNIEKVEFCD